MVLTMQWKLRFASLTVFLSMLYPQVWAAGSFEERLQAADQARSSDPKMFMGLL
jgi:hypothetical protein